MNAIRIYLHAVKYWLRGDPWRDAVAFARVLIGGWSR